MNWMIEELLNYDFKKENRNQMISNLLMLALGKLEQNYNMPKGQTVGFMDSSVGENLRACANQETGEVKFNAKFLQDKSKYGRDMMTVFHELRHIAQYHGKKNEPQKTDRLHLTYANHPDLVTMLVCTDLCKRGESIGEAWRYDSTVTAIYHQRWNEYLFAKYFYSPCERDARAFGRNFLDSIMKTVDEKELNETQKKNYNVIKKCIEEDTKKENEQLQKFAETIKGDDKSFVETCKKAQQENIEMCDQATCMSASSAKSYITNRGFDCFNAIFTSLCFVYDEKIAQKFYKYCLQMEENEDGRYCNYALNLIKYSEFKPNEKQFKALCNKCEEYNKTKENKSEHINPKKTLEKMKTNQTRESMEQSIGML